MKYLVSVSSLLFLLFSCSILINGRSIEDDITTIRQRVIELTLWPSKNNITNIIQLALFYSEKLNSSCYWDDIKYSDRGVAVWTVEEHLIRVDYMLKALTFPGSSVENNTKLANLTHCALNIWLVRDWQNPNWWFNQIGIPLLITGQLLLLGNHATQFEIEKITNISYRSDWWNHDSDNGANLVWMLQIELYRSLATNNQTGLEQAFTRLWQDVVVLPTAGVGIQTDWSYHFHGLILYSAGYGQDWSVAVMIFMICTKNTQYQPTQQQLVTFANFLTQGNAWMINENIWDWQVQGRTFDRPGTVFASLGFEVEPDWIRSLADLIQTDNLKKDLLNFADRMDGKPNAIPLLGNKHFYKSDYQAHRRTNWTCAIKMQSIRTRPTECINGENKKGEHLGQGVLTLYTNNVTEYRGIFPLFDWQTINGITVEHDISLEPCNDGHFPLILLDFVGGVSDGNYGLAAMNTGSHNLTAKRSWHFYDDGIIALASNLTVTTKTTPWTTLASRFSLKGIITVGFFNGTIISLSDGINYSFPYSNDKTKNVQWLHIGESNIGYLLQNQELYSSVGAEVSTKTASYSTIGPYNDTITGRTVTLWIDHGLGPYTRDYNYMILPNVSVHLMSELIQRYNNEQLFSCITNNNLFHGIAWPTLQRASFVLWNKMSTTFSCQSPSFKLTAQLNNDGFYLFNENSTDFSITISYPTFMHSNITINVDRVGFGQGCVALSDFTTNVTITLPSQRQYMGSSVTVTCKKTQFYHHKTLN